MKVGLPLPIEQEAGVVIGEPRHWSTMSPWLVKWIPTFVPSRFSCTIRKSSLRKRWDSASPMITIGFGLKEHLHYLIEIHYALGENAFLKMAVTFLRVIRD
jgi:hypothetical protein